MNFMFFLNILFHMANKLIFWGVFCNNICSDILRRKHAGLEKNCKLQTLFIFYVSGRKFIYHLGI